MQRKSGSKRLMIILAAITLSFGLFGCNSSEKANTAEEGRKDAKSIQEENYVTAEAETSMEESGTAEAGEAAGAIHTEYPVTITTYGSTGEEITTTYEKAPEKVLAVYQGSIETMLALGLADHLTATAGLDNEVPDAMKADFSKLKYLDEFTPSLETVTMLEPDMILSWGSLFKEKTLGDAQGWIDKGVNIYINSNTRPDQGDITYARTLENEYTDILNLGKIFDVQNKAKELVNDMKNTISAVKEKTADNEDKPLVLILESYGDTFSNYGALSLAGDMVTQLGGELASPDGWELGKEDVISLNPDIIFVVYMPYAGDDAETVKQENLQVLLGDDAYASLDAVKNNRIIPIMLSEMYASATRTKDGIVTFAKGLYPELELEE